MKKSSSAIAARDEIGEHDPVWPIALAYETPTQWVYESVCCPGMCHTGIVIRTSPATSLGCPIDPDPPALVAPPIQVESALSVDGFRNSIEIPEGRNLFSQLTGRAHQDFYGDADVGTQSVSEGSGAIKSIGEGYMVQTLLPRFQLATGVSSVLEPFEFRLLKISREHGSFYVADMCRRKSSELGCPVVEGRWLRTSKNQSTGKDGPLFRLQLNVGGPVRPHWAETWMIANSTGHESANLADSTVKVATAPKRMAAKKRKPTR